MYGTSHQATANQAASTSTSTSTSNHFSVTIITMAVVCINNLLLALGMLATTTMAFTSTANFLLARSRILHQSIISSCRRSSGSSFEVSDVPRLFSTKTPIEEDAKLTSSSGNHTSLSGTASTKNNKQKYDKHQNQTIVYPSPPDPSTFPSWSYEPRPHFHFEIIHQSTKSSARVGRIHTPHGTIDTPSYVAVATNAALKGVDIRDADSTGQQLIFCNTYHLLLQPGTDVVEGAGGLHKFMNRKAGPLITDSGGFQVFSLAYGSVYEEISTGGELKRRNANDSKKGSSLHLGNEGGNKPPVKVTEEGAIFRSYRDGKSFLLTPESTVQAQKSFGADVSLIIHHCFHHTSVSKQCTALTHKYFFLFSSSRLSSHWMNCHHIISIGMYW